MSQIPPKPFDYDRLLADAQRWRDAWDFLQAAEWIASKRSSSAAPAITKADWGAFDSSYAEMQQEKKASRP